MDFNEFYDNECLAKIKESACKWYNANGEFDAAIPQEMFDDVCQKLKDATGEHVNPYGHIVYFYPSAGGIGIAPATYFGMKILSMVYPDSEWLKRAAPVLTQLYN